MLKAIVASGRIALGLLSVTLCTIVIAMRLGVPLAQISRGALSLVGERTLRHRGMEAKVVLASAPCSFARMLAKAGALGGSGSRRPGATMQAIRQYEGVTHGRVAHLVDLAFLAPDMPGR